MNKTVKIVKAVFSFFIGAAALPAAVLVALTVLPKAFGYETGVVESGSMEPAIHVGSLSYIEEVDPEDIQVGDIITYVTGTDDSVTVEHRVVAIDTENETVTTKGDANDANDISPVPYTSIVGSHVTSIPYLGYISAWVMMHYEGLLVILVVLVISDAVLGYALRSQADDADGDGGNNSDSGQGQALPEIEDPKRLQTQEK